MRRMYSKSQIEKIIDEHGGGGSGAVNKVNGKVGNVVLDARDIKLTTNNQTIQQNFIRVDERIDGKQDQLVAGNNITISGNVISASGGGAGGYTYINEDTSNEELYIGDWGSSTFPKSVSINTMGDNTSDQCSVWVRSTSGGNAIDITADAGNSGKVATISLAAADAEAGYPAASRISIDADTIYYANNTLIAYDENLDAVLINTNMLPQEDPHIEGMIYVASDGTLKASRPE